MKLAFAVLLLAAPLPAAAGDRIEITVFGGLSVLDAATADESRDLVCPGGFISGLPREGCVERFLTRRTSLGPSFLQGTGVAYRFGARSSLELSFAAAPGHGLTYSVDAACSPESACLSLGESAFREGSPLDIQTLVAYHADVVFRYSPWRGDARPFIAGGAGWVEYDGVDYYGDPKGEATVVVGAGLELKLGERLNARLEALDHVVAGQFLSDETEHDVHVRIGLTVRP